MLALHYVFKRLNGVSARSASSFKFHYWEKETDGRDKEEETVPLASPTQDAAEASFDVVERVRENAGAYDQSSVYNGDRYTFDPRRDSTLMEGTSSAHKKLQTNGKVVIFVGAALSMIDMLTDIVMIVQFFRTGETGYGYASLGSLLFNLLLQTAVTYLQNSVGTWQTILREHMYVWTFVKPWVDAWRVASGAAHLEGRIMNAAYELTFNKGSFDGFSDLDDNELIPAPLPPTTNPRLASGFRFPPYNCAAGETVTYDEESIQGILSACRIDIPTLFGYTDDNLAVGITGSVDLVELDGPVVVLTLGGRFWHQRPTVLMRVKAYLQERCPEIVDVVVGDEWELTDEANV
ncbi:hypothetical protein TrRE_jg2782 [Triparma retinervis]|uniref:Uncharacterized protein n=1 Tax=Triparma retinervis TaxID=2557542 RepID=A0A9W7APQ2_9STRA|nr:hypothetical protein TrRE_jg2782 [Triparma retinervis]